VPPWVVFFGGVNCRSGGCYLLPVTLRRWIRYVCCLFHSPGPNPSPFPLQPQPQPLAPSICILIMVLCGYGRKCGWKGGLNDVDMGAGRFFVSDIDLREHGLGSYSPRPATPWAKAYDKWRYGAVLSSACTGAAAHWWALLPSYYPALSPAATPLWRAAALPAGFACPPVSRRAAHTMRIPNMCVCAWQVACWAYAPWANLGALCFAHRFVSGKGVSERGRTWRSVRGSGASAPPYYTFLYLSAPATRTYLRRNGCAAACTT